MPRNVGTSLDRELRASKCAGSWNEAPERGGCTLGQANARGQAAPGA